MDAATILLEPKSSSCDPNLGPRLVNPGGEHRSLGIVDDSGFTRDSEHIELQFAPKTPNGKSKSENERSPERTPELGGEVEEDELPVKYLVGVDVRWPASRRRKLQRILEMRIYQDVFYLSWGI
ncbi:hypothetical protein U1Q18_015025 [Sarracenia purpurea var. burkii]